MVLTGKEWNPETWNGNICLAPDETHSLELPSHSEPSLLMEVACLSVSETNLSLFENAVINSTGPDVLGDFQVSLSVSLWRSCKFSPLFLEHSHISPFSG